MNCIASGVGSTRERARRRFDLVSFLRLHRLVRGETRQLGREHAQLVVELGQPEGQLVDLPLAARRVGRGAQDLTLRGDRAMDAGLRADDGELADLGVVLDPGLAAHDDVVARLATAGDPDLPAEQVVLADPVVVADHDEVVDLGPLAQDGRLEGSPVDRAVGPDLDVVVDLDRADLGGFDVPAVDHFVSEPVGTEHRARVDLDAVAQRRAVVEDDVRVKDHVAADPAAVADDDVRLERRTVADLGIVAHDDEGVDRDPLADPGRGGDDGRGMDSHPARRFAALEMGANGDERRAGVVDLDDGQVAVGRGELAKMGPHDRGRRGRGPKHLGVTFVVDERDVARPGFGHGTGRLDRDVAVADQSAMYERGELFHGGNHAHLPFFPERSGTAGSRPRPGRPTEGSS